MKRMLLILMTFVIALNLAACGGNSAPAQTEATETAPAVPAADAVYTGAVIYTEDAENTVAEAMAVRDGKIIYVGSAEGAQAYIGEGTEATNLEGKMITPNLIDSHSHPGIVATTAWYTDMPADCDTQEEILAFVKDFCDTHSAEEYPYIYFEYYPSNLFDENGPRREWIDEVVSDRAILIEDFSDHACWVNTRFLELIGAFDEGVISEADKEFMTNSEGEYTGWIREFVWQNYIGNLYEKTGFTPSEEVNEENLTPVLDDFKSWGVTAVMDACVLDDAHVKTVSVFGIQDGPDGLVVLHVEEFHQLSDGQLFLEVGLVLDECFGFLDLASEGLEVPEVWVLNEPLEEGRKSRPVFSGKQGRASLT